MLFHQTKLRLVHWVCEWRPKIQRAGRCNKIQLYYAFRSNCDKRDDQTQETMFTLVIHQKPFCGKSLLEKSVPAMLVCGLCIFQGGRRQLLDVCFLHMLYPWHFLTRCVFFTCCISDIFWLVDFQTAAGVSVSQPASGSQVCLSVGVIRASGLRVSSPCDLSGQRWLVRLKLLLLISFIYRYSLLSSRLTTLICDSLHEWLVIVCFSISTEVVYLQRWHGWCHMKLLSSVYSMQPCTMLLHAKSHT